MLVYLDLSNHIVEAPCRQIVRRQDIFGWLKLYKIYSVVVVVVREKRKIKIIISKGMGRNNQSETRQTPEKQ